MKRIGNLFEQICSIGNLRLADQKASAGKSHQAGVIKHRQDPEANLLKLHHQLVTKTYTTSAYRTFKIYEPKERMISELPYRDRIVHHAIMNLLEQPLVAMFTADTYSCIKGRGIHGCGRAIKRALKDEAGTRYCLKLDVVKFYPSVDHDILKMIIRRKIKDAALLWLLDDIIDSASGLPIGNYLSQYLSTLYLNGLDHHLKENLKVKYVLRYADDIAILAATKPELHALLAEIRRYLEAELKLSIKKSYQVFPVEARGLDMIGYVFRHSYTRLRPSIKHNAARAAAAGAPAQVTNSFKGWMKHCDARHLAKKLFP